MNINIIYSFDWDKIYLALLIKKNVRHSIWFDNVLFALKYKYHIKNKKDMQVVQTILQIWISNKNNITNLKPFSIIMYFKNPTIIL